MFDDYIDVYIPTEDGHIFSKYTNKILKEHTSKSNGYNNVTLIHPKTRKKKTINVHRYVAYFLVEGYDENKVVNHKDGVRTNNSISNLEWITQKENIQHAIHQLKTRDFRGDKHPMYGKKVSEESKIKMVKNRRVTKGKDHWRSKPVIVENRFTGEIKKFESLSIASKELKLSYGNMYYVLSGVRKYVKEYYVRYDDQQLV